VETASSSFSAGTPETATLGSTGTPTWAISSFASSLFPMEAMAVGDGPTKTSPASLTARANAGLSARKP
jgi:hypothetical protein